MVSSCPPCPSLLISTVIWYRPIPFVICMKTKNGVVIPGNAGTIKFSNIPTIADLRLNGSLSTASQSNIALHIGGGFPDACFFGFLFATFPPRAYRQFSVGEATQKNCLRFTRPLGNRGFFARRDENERRHENSAGGGAKKTSACVVSALLRTRGSVRAPQVRVLDPTTFGGLASTELNIGSLRVLHRFFKSVAWSRAPQRLLKPFRASCDDSNTRLRGMQVKEKGFALRGSNSQARQAPNGPRGDRATHKPEA